jgi:alkylhydroperoxidase/carboxymuconolactone decarboxylase family protein YurZ
MARLPYLPPDALDPGDPDLVERPINLFRILAHSPGALRAWKDMGDWIREGTSIDPRLRELAILEVAVAAGNRYVFSHHSQIGRRFQVTAADAALVATCQIRPVSPGPTRRTQSCPPPGSSAPPAASTPGPGRHSPHSSPPHSASTC